MAATIRLSQQHSCSFDHLVGEQLHRIGNREAQRLRSLEIDNEFKLGGSLYRQVGRLLSPDNSAGVDTRLAIRVRKDASVAHKAACDGKLTHRIYCRNRMAPRERDDVIAALQEERIDADKESNAAFLRHSRERCLHLSFGTGRQGNELQPKHTGSRLHIFQLSLGPRKIRIHQYRDCGSTGSEFAQQSQLLDPSSTIKLLTPVTLPPGRFKLATRPNLIGSSPVVNTIGTVEVAVLAARAAGLVVAAMTVTLRWIRSAASAGSRS